MDERAIKRTPLPEDGSSNASPIRSERPEGRGINSVSSSKDSQPALEGDITRLGTNVDEL